MRFMHVIYEGAGVLEVPPLTWGKRCVLAWGKLRRFYLLTFRPAYVEASLKRRRGTCHRTGACCKLAFGCPLLSWLERVPICRGYKRRPRNCMTFPIDERDILDRNRVNPWEPCGFTFIERDETREDEEGDRRAAPVLEAGASRASSRYRINLTNTRVLD